jgi:hypothetical protein
MTGMRLEWVEMGALDEGGVFDATEVVEGVKHTGGMRTRQEGGIQENVEDHIEGTPSNGPGHGVSGGAGLGACEVAGGGEDPPVDAPAIVQQIAYGYL